MKKLTQKILFGLVGKIAIVSLMAIFFTMFNSNTQAQTLLVNYDFASAVAGSTCTATPLTTAPGVTSIFTAGGTNGGACTTSEGSHSEIGYAFTENKEANLAVDLSSSDIDAESYFQVQLTNVSAYRGYKLYFQAMQSGPIDVQYSLDGITFTNFTQLPNPIVKWRFPPTIVDLSSVTAIDRQPTVYFRLVGKSDGNSGLTFRIDNFQVQATAATKSRKRVRFF
jgi:hypothetical protein